MAYTHAQYSRMDLLVPNQYSAFICFAFAIVFGWHTSYKEQLQVIISFFRKKKLKETFFKKKLKLVQLILVLFRFTFVFKKNIFKKKQLKHIQTVKSKAKTYVLTKCTKRFWTAYDAEPYRLTGVVNVHR